jgi:hypothetical protein
LKVCRRREALAGWSTGIQRSGAKFVERGTTKQSIAEGRLACSDISHVPLFFMHLSRRCRSPHCCSQQLLDKLTLTTNQSMPCQKEERDDDQK